jgi:hypothetical protein
MGNLPVSPVPRSMIFCFNPSSESELVFADFDTRIFTLFVVAGGTAADGALWFCVSESFIDADDDEDDE